MLAKQAFWQVHIPPPNEINHPHYDVTNPNEQHQFDLLYFPNNIFEGNKYKYISRDVHVALRYKVTRALRTKKWSESSFVLEATYKKGGVFKYPKVFQCDYGSEFRRDVTKLIENTMLIFKEQQENINTTTPLFWRHLTRNWQNSCLSPWMLKSFQTLTKCQ